MDVSAVARKWVLQNASRYEGKASSGAVISKILGEHPELKTRMKDVSEAIAQVIKEVNAMTVDDQLAELKKNHPELLEKPKEEPKLKPLPEAVEGEVVTRFAPSASGPMHIGHAFGLCLNALYAEHYKGRFVLRIEDTNPENIYPPAYEMIEEDARWLANVAEVVVQSDRLGMYYDVAEKLVRRGHAYVCKCDPDVWRALSREGRACACRDLPAEEHSLRWAKMFSEYKPGEAVLRIKTRLDDPNPAMRDWPAFRINDHVHARTGTEHRVWPLMNFSVSVDDHDLGITHSVRGKDHADNEKRQRFVYNYMGWKPPVARFIGMINFPDFELSTTQTRLKIEHGEYTGWDDPCLPFLAAFRRRGYQPGAFRRFAFEMGVSLTDKKVSSDEFFKILDAFNKDIVDPVADRYFFVESPVRFDVKDAPSFPVELDLHPGYPDRGRRVMQTNGSFYISKGDEKLLKGEVRLIECMNVNKGKFVSRELKKGLPLIHWLPVSDSLVDVQVLMPDGSLKAGKGEPGLRGLKVGDVIQFERFGFVRLDSVENGTYRFFFAHR